MTSNASMVFCRGCGKEIHQSAPTCPQCGFAQSTSRSTSEKPDNFISMMSSSTKICTKKYATFKGRSSRSEYWYFYLTVIIASIICAIIDEILGTRAFNTGIQCAFFLPLLAAGSRRLHDIGKSGWWQLLMIPLIGIFVLIYWWAQKGSQEENEYGPAQ